MNCFIASQHNPNFVLEIKDRSESKGASLVINPFHGGPSQQFQIFSIDDSKTILSSLTGFALTNSRNGLVLMPYEKANNQVWKLKRTGQISSSDGTALDVCNNSFVPNQPVIAYKEHGADNQKWIIVTRY